jgi:ribosomal protein S12 methylthiotransferase accessory factor
MEMIVDFPGGDRVDAHFGNFTVKTDQRSATGEQSAPAPFSLFLASIGTCAGIYVKHFCDQRGISAEGIRIVQRDHRDAQSGMVNLIDLEIQVPPTFPEKYTRALVNTAELCAVKRHLMNPPQFNTYTKVIEE